MKILITGASGYLGSQLCSKFSEIFDVTAIVRSSSSRNRLKDIEHFMIKQADNKRELDYIFKSVKPDIIINTVALYGRHGESFSDLVYANIQYPCELFDLCMKYNVKMMIHTGTSLPKNISDYALTKNTVIDLIKSKENDITKFINIELEHFYGPNDDTSKFISYIIDECIKGNELKLTHGKQERDFIFIDDVISAYKAIIENDDKLSNFDSLSIGSGTTIKIKEIVELIHSISNSKADLNFGVIDMRKNELMYSCADLNKIKSLCWKPEFSLEHGLNKILLERDL